MYKFIYIINGKYNFAYKSTYIKAKTHNIIKYYKHEVVLLCIIQTESRVFTGFKDRDKN